MIDHSRPLSEELKRIGIREVTYVAALTRTDLHFQEIIKSLQPQGKIALIDDPGPVDVNDLKSKCISLHWEMMFTRPLHETPDMIAQHNLLTEASDLIDDGIIRTTFKEHYAKISAENLRKAHALIESGKSIGKVVLEGF